LPEDFLRKLTSDLEAALLTASDFEINLANRATMEDVWQEAIEFNNADFDDLFKNANADVMLMMSPRAISTGVEIAITAYSLIGDNVGKTLASSGSVLLPIDLQANLGVDVNDLNKQMAQVLAEIEKVGQTGGLISSPNTYAEFYHNARLLQQRGEVDLAMRNYEAAVKEGVNFIDPIIDLIQLADTRYGKEAAKKYLQKRIIPEVHEQQNLFINYYYFWTDFEKQNLIIADLDASPLLSIVVALGDGLEFSGEKAGAKNDMLWRHAFELVSQKNTKFSFEKYFIDDIRAYSLFERSRQLKTMIADGDPNKPGWGKNYYLGITRSSLTFFDQARAYLTIFEKIDFSKPPQICSSSMSGDERCYEFFRNSTYKDWYQSEVFSPLLFENWCNMSARYFSHFGVLTKTPVIIESARFSSEDLENCNKYVVN